MKNGTGSPAASITVPIRTAKMNGPYAATAAAQPPRPADPPARLPGREDHRHLLEGRGVPDPCEEEQPEHAEDEPEERGGRGRLEEERDADRRAEQADPRDLGEPGASELVRERSRRHPGRRPDQRAEEGVRARLRRAL